MSSEGALEQDTSKTSYKSLNIGGSSDVESKIPSKILTAGVNDTRKESQTDQNQSSDDDDDDLLITGFNAPTPRSPEDDLVLALQENADETLFSQCLNRLMTACCGCCCCCVYTQSTSQSASQLLPKTDLNHLTESSPAYWHKYPFMKLAHRMWRIYFLCYLLLAIPSIYASHTIFATACTNSDINHSLADVIDLTDSSSNFCNLYYWIYIWFVPFLFLIVAYITERVTLHNDMRGDRLICLLNIICLLIIIYFFVFFNHINSLVIDYVCADYASSLSASLRNGCKDQIRVFPIWVLCNTIYLAFTCINIIHERVISLYMTLYDFKPTIVKHRASHMYRKGKRSSSNLKRNTRNVFTLRFWSSHVIQPSKTALYHVVFNIFHLDRHNMKLGLFYVWSEIKRNNFSFFIGLFTVFISCFVGGFLPAVNDKSAVVFIKLAENSVGENDMLLTAQVIGVSSSSSSSSTVNNNTHNETLQYIYNDDWIYSVNLDNISNLLAANNITTSQMEDFLDDIDINSTITSNITDAIMNITGISWQQLHDIARFWNENNDAISLDNLQAFIANTTQTMNQNAAALNLSNGEHLDWTVEVQNELFSSNPMLNYTYIEEKLDGVYEVSGSAPRWWLLGNVTAGKSMYAASTIVMAIDSVLELEAGIGRAWKDVAPLEGNGAYVMNSIARAMNITSGDNDYDHAVGEDFVMFANLGGIQDSFDMHFADSFLDTTSSVAMEENLIRTGVAFSCISVNIHPKARANDFEWMIYENTAAETNATQLANGSVYANTNSCIYATQMEYLFRIEDVFGNGLVDGYYTITWDNETALYSEGKFRYGSYETKIVTRPSAAYGKSMIMMNDTQQEDFARFLGVILSKRTQRAVFNNMIGGRVDVDTTDMIMDEILPDYNATDMVQQLQNASYNESVALIGGWIVYYIGFGAQLNVAESVASGGGKWSSLLGSVTVIDAQELADIVFNSSMQFGLAINNLMNIGVGLGYITSRKSIENMELIEYYLESIASTDLYEFALQTIIMYTDRLDAYMGTLLSLDEHMVSFSNAVFNHLGYDFSAMITLPIYTQMQFIMFSKLFLNEMLFLCIVLMTTLVLIVIYSLLLNDVEERTYTYGMLRALGMKRVTLIQIMLLKAITFSIPATLIALALVQLMNVPLIEVISSFACISLSISLPSASYVHGVLIGFCIPLVAIYVPTSRALSKTLRDSLDVYHHVASDMKVTMIRLEKVGFSVPIMGVAIILVCYGVICSILLPISIYYQSKNVCFSIFNFVELCFGSGFDLAFGILGSIMLSMMYGMCIIAALLSMPLASLLIHCVLHKSHLQSVVLKNLHSHSSRNMKTSIMFITTLAFCIFAGVSNSFLTNSAVDLFAWLTGSDFEIYAFWQKDALPIDELRVYLDQQKEKGIIEDYTAITFPISWYANDEFIIDEITVSSLAGQPKLSQWIVGCEENYLNVMWDRFLDIAQIGAYHNGSLPRLRNDKDYDVVKILYTDAGHATLDFERENGIVVPQRIINSYDEESLNRSYYDYIDVVVSTSLVSALGIDMNDPLVLTVGVYDVNYKYYEFVYMMKIRAILNKIPGLVMMPYDLQFVSFLAEYQNAVISMPSYNAIFAEIGEFLKVDVPSNIWQKIGIKMAPHATDNDFEDINEGIRNFVPNQQVEVDNMHEVDKQVRGNISLINDFFLILGIIGIVLSFFILWLSFLANIRNSSWELGVLRAIGVNTVEVTCIYIYEAMAIISSCIMLGTVIGTATSLILCSQSNLFMMMPLYLDFPWSMYASICTVAIVVAAIGSYLPMRRYIYTNVASVLRGK